MVTLCLWRRNYDIFSVVVVHYNGNIKGGREFFDIENIKDVELINKLKKVSYEDIYFNVRGEICYEPHFRDIELDKQVQSSLPKYSKIFFGKASDAQMEENLFGDKIGHRFHTGGLPDKLKGIGLGYKIYKAFIKKMGYITSNTQVSADARKVYYKLIQDPDYYHIIDNGSNKADYNNGYQKIIIIDKKYKKLRELLELVKDFEKSHNLQFIYDKDLIKKPL